MTVAGRHMVVTGGGSGVGAEIARVFARAGAKVTVLGRRIEPLEAIARETGALAVAADVTDRPAVDAALDRAASEQGPVEIAIANAGHAASAPFGKVSERDFADAQAVNLGGVFHLWQAAHASMKRSGWGRLIAIASTAGLKGYPYVSAYCAAKHGVVGLTRALAHELGATGITVNAICPGFIDTPLLGRSIDTIVAKTGMTREKAEKSLVAGNPQRRLIEAREVAETALWLCSDDARSINGHALSMSGGEI